MLPRTRLLEPPPPPQPQQALSPSTPKTAAEIEWFSRKHLQGVCPYTGKIGLLEGRVTKLAKAAVAVAAVRKQLELDLKRQTAATNNRKKRQISDRRVVQTGSVITV